MTNVLLLVGGALLVAFVLYDFLRTAISLSGLGPISSAIAYALWSAARHCVPWSERRLGLDIRGLIGPTILSAIALSWIIFTLAGYTLMYAAGPSLSLNDGDRRCCIKSAKSLVIKRNTSMA